MTQTRRHLLAALGAGLALEGLHLATAVTLGGCGGSTTGDLVELTTSIASDLDPDEAFENRHGWRVSLTRVQIALAALHLFDDADPNLAQRLLTLPSAHAHAGHIEGAGIRGEMLRPAVVDLATGPQALGLARGVTGAVGSGHVQFDDEGLDGWAVVLAGEARRDGEQRLFVARAATAELVSAHGDAEVFGCPVSVDELGGDAELALVAQVSAWLDDVEFVMQPASSEPLELDRVVGTHDAFLHALRDEATWRFVVQEAA